MKYRGRITGKDGLPDLNFEVWAEKDEEAISVFKGIVKVLASSRWHEFQLFPPQGVKEQDMLAWIDTARTIQLIVRNIKTKKEGVKN